MSGSPESPISATPPQPQLDNQPPQTSPQPSFTNPSVNSRSARPIKLYTIIAILIVGLLVTGSALAYVVMNQTSERVDTKPVPQTDKTDLASPTLDLVSDWQTYNLNGISFRYPLTWNAQEYEIDTTYKYKGIVRLTNDSLSGVDNPPGYMDISRWENPENLSLAQFDRQVIASEFVPNRLSQPNAKPIKIAGIDSFHTANFDCSPHSCEQYVVPTDGAIYEIHFYLPAVTQAQIDQILSTFEFVDKITSRNIGHNLSEQFTTFTSQEYNFSFGYPDNFEVAIFDDSNFQAEYWPGYQNQFMLIIPGTDQAYLFVHAIKSSLDPIDWWSKYGQIGYELMSKDQEKLVNYDITLNYYMEQTELSGTPALKVTTTNGSAGTQQLPEEFYTTIVQHRGNILMIRQHKEVGSRLALSQQILSSFKLLE